VIDAVTGATITAIPLSLFPVSDPIVDSTNQTVFVFFAAYPSFNLTVEQFDTSGTLLRQIAVGPVSGDVNMFTGTFNDKYFSNPSSGSLYSSGAVNFIASLYGVGFTGTTMNAVAAGPLVLATSPFTNVPTPLTEIYSPNIVGSPDRLFLGIDSDCAGGPDSPGCIENFNISNGFPSAILDAFTLAGTGSALDVSGIIAQTYVCATPGFYASHCYVVVIQDVRGQYKSDGFFYTD
jgi:hypothetical protein